MAVHCGYHGSLASLVASNGDYVIDATCTRLRTITRHPRAPHLLAALLRHCKAAAALLPLLAEPLTRALQGLGILARAAQPQYIGPFISVLQEVVEAAVQEAEAAGADTDAAVADINARLLEGEAAYRAAAEARRCARVASGSQASSSSAESEAAHYFMRRAARVRAGLPADGPEEAGEEGYDQEEEEAGEAHGSLLSATWANHNLHTNLA